jgi:hypothetical protein
MGAKKHVVVALVEIEDLKGMSDEQRPATTWLARGA